MPNPPPQAAAADQPQPPSLGAASTSAQSPADGSERHRRHTSAELRSALRRSERQRLLAMSRPPGATNPSPDQQTESMDTGSPPNTQLNAPPPADASHQPGASSSKRPHIDMDATIEHRLVYPTAAQPPTFATDPSFILTDQLCKMSEKMMETMQLVSQQQAASLEVERRMREERIAERRENAAQLKQAQEMATLKDLVREQSETIRHLSEKIDELTNATPHDSQLVAHAHINPPAAVQPTYRSQASLPPRTSPPPRPPSSDQRPPPSQPPPPTIQSQPPHDPPPPAPIQTMPPNDQRPLPPPPIEHPPRPTPANPQQQPQAGPEIANAQQAVVPRQPSQNTPNLSTTSEPLARCTVHLLSPSTSCSTASGIQATQTGVTSQSAVHGHKKLIDLPEFSGRTETWSSFHSAYVNSSTAYAYDSTDNTFRLQKCLTGEARQSVLGMLNDVHNADGVMDTLEMLYGQTKMLIRCEILKAKALQPIHQDHLEQWAPFAAKVRNMAATIESFERSKQRHCNELLIEELVFKLPGPDRLLWSDVVDDMTDEPTTHDFAEWLMKRARKASRFAQKPPEISQSQPSTMLLAERNPHPPPAGCALCAGAHAVPECNEFLQVATSARWDTVKRLRLCFRCLKDGHSYIRCRSRRKCNIDGCERIHHPLLHENVETTTHPEEPTRQTPGTSAAQTARPFSTQSRPFNLHVPVTVSEPELLMRIVPVKLHGPSGDIPTYALFDEAAKVTLLDASLADELGLDGTQCNLNLSWYGGKQSSESSKAVNLEISGTSTKTYAVTNAYTVRNLQLPKQTLAMSRLHSRFRHLKNLPIASLRDATPKILLGLDHCRLGAPKQIIEADDGRLIATRTRLGWMLYGGVCEENETERKTMLLTTQNTEEEDLHETVRQFHTTESFGVRALPALESKSDARARWIMEATTTRRDGHFETGLLWASDDVRLPRSRAMAISRLSSVEGRMARDPQFAATYEQNITDYVTKGYARMLTADEAAKETPRTWYLPHFGVENPNKPGKIRLVFDAAAKVGQTSLNSVLLTGPDGSASLHKILHRFRMGAVGICGDIQEMFHRIAIRKEDQDSQRFVWRSGDRSKPVNTYVMQAMTFGARCSPCSAQFVKNINALGARDAHPAAVDAILNHHYVDDYVMSFPSTSAAANTTKEVIAIHRHGGFNLRNFRSNCPDVLRALGCDGAGEPVDLRLEDTPEKILGMFWDAQADEFTFKLNLHKIPQDVADLRKPPTKRQILSVTMAVYDPFGLLCDFMLQAKLMVQDVWRLGSGWDDPISPEIERKWAPWVKELKKIENCRVPRCYSPHLLSAKNVQLHVFADASEEAFAAVAYWRIESTAGAIDVAFVSGKTRCAPLKTLTIPRLELQAAVLATRLRASVLECHEIQVNQTFFWSDSTTVLKWIESDHRRFKPFVAHRVAEILESSTEKEWRYIPTAENVADDATRANAETIFNPDSRWLRGPELLRRDESSWPSRPYNVAEKTTDEELRPRYAMLTDVTPDATIEWKRFSSFKTMVKTVAWILRFARNMRSFRGFPKSGERKTPREPLDAAEIRGAEETLCRLVQAEVYAEERAALERSEPVGEKSKVYCLQPYLDAAGTMRLRGRTDAADALPEETRRPIILPKEHAVTRMLVHQVHQTLRHQNQAAVVCTVRQRFWIPQLRSLVRSTRSRCLFCRIKNAKPTTPQMGQLPPDRLTPFVRPFTYTGLDYFGPLTVAIGRRHEKRWVALFSCLTTRALHLELATDLSTDSCILCLRNFMNLRGVPVSIRSDNGTNFVGADKILRDLSGELTSSKIAQELASKGVKWTFNSPSNPEAGGCWERMVGCVKRILAVTLVESSPRIETLRSLLLEAANIINSRPLTHLPVDPDTEEPLTPNHFLLGGASSTQTPGPIDERQMCSRKQWRVLQQMKNAFWRRWIKEYLPELTRRTKWHRDTPSLQVDDLVLICDDDSSCNNWRRGRIVAVFPGPDGKVRNCEVRTSTGNLRRPASRLAKLDVNAD